MDVISTQSDAIQGYKSPIFRSPKTTPSKPSHDSDEWKECYEVTENIAAIYPTTVGIPYPFAIPRESYDDMSESQKKAVCWMWYNLFDSCRGGVLADTLANNLMQVTQFLHGLCLPRLVYKCLLVVPTQAVDLWVSALIQLAPRVRVVEFTGPQRERRLAQVLQLGGIVVTTYGIAMNDLIPKGDPTAASFDSSEDGSQAPKNGAKSYGDDVWDVIVLDQADRLKDSTSKTTEALSRLQGNVNLLLTSHPILKHPKDLYTLFDFACEADIFGSYEQFRDRFEVPIHRSLGKRADDMDRQLAAMARIQLAQVIDTQYWQNWSEILTPGGSKRAEALPAFCATPTPFKKSASSVRDLAATPSFSKSKSMTVAGSTAKKARANNDGPLTPSSTLKTGKKGKRGAKPKSLMPEVIVLDEDDTMPRFGLDDLENSISNLNLDTIMHTPMAKKQDTGKRENPIELSDTPVRSPSRPARRTPVRNAFYSNAAMLEGTPTKLGIGEHVDSACSTPKSGIFSPAVLQARQRASFGRISLLDEGDGNREAADNEEADCDFAAQMGAKWRPGVAGTPHKAKSLAALEWPSTKMFLKWRDAFAMRLFAELNQVIFQSRLPELTLNWRKMKNCAGVYHYKDSSITLSSTLLTNGARLTSTLAHEMAHAATHLLDLCPNDGHGPVWQKWARIGHARYPSIITGSVYHNYCSQNLHPEDESH